MLLTIRALSAFIALFFVDIYIRILDARKGICAAIIIVIGSCCLYGYASSHGVYSLYILGSVLAGMGYSLGSLVVVSELINRWFASRRAFATGICSAGTGIATVVLAPLVTFFADRFSLSSAFFFEAIAGVAILIVSSAFLRDYPEEIGASAYVSREDKKKEIRSFGGNLPSRMFLLAIVTSFCMGVAAYIIVGILPALYTEVGFSSAMVSSLVSLYGGILIFSKLAYGRLVDAHGTFRVSIIYSVLLIASAVLQLFAYQGGAAAAYLSAGLIGIGLPVSTIGITCNARDFSDEKSFSRNLKLMQCSYTAGSMLCGMLIGRVADITGSYLYDAALFIVFYLVYLIGIAVLYRRPHRQTFSILS